MNTSILNRTRSSWQSWFTGIFRKKFMSWVNKHIPPARHITLHLKNIFIIPNLQGLGFCGVLALMFVGAANYEINLAFALVFMLIGMFLLTILYTYRNLAGLHISASGTDTVFAGENAEISVVLSRQGERVHEAINLSFENSHSQLANLVDNREARVKLYIPTSKRGYFHPGRLRIDTVYPFGLCTAWSLQDLQLEFLVYPKPVSCDIEFLEDNIHETGNTRISTGADDFYSLREYQKGDPLRHVAWKQFARGQGMLIKQYASHVDDRIWLHWDMFAGLGVEEKLSRLCYCVIKLDAANMDYGLHLPGISIEPSKGSAHYHQIMRELALFDSGETR